jgi:hypothetical protein
MDVLFAQRDNIPEKASTKYNINDFLSKLFLTMQAEITKHHSLSMTCRN